VFRGRSLVHVFSVADSLIFVKDQVRRLCELGMDVTLVTSPDERLKTTGMELGVRTVGIPMARRVSPLEDWESLGRLRSLFDELRPDLVHAHTPKGGLLGMLSAAASNVPVRLYQMRGLAYVTLSGRMRALLQTTERVSCRAATRVICQSRSLLETATSDRLLPAHRAEVVLEGSNGVDVARFQRGRWADEGQALRASWGAVADDVVFLFVGRLVKDKGVPELLEAYARVRALNPRAQLVLVGPLEDRDALEPETVAQLSAPGVRSLGFQSNPAPFLAAADVLVLPSHREGFPNAPLEAAAMGLPVVSTPVPGCRDAVEDGVTGVLVPVANAAALADAMQRYVAEPVLRRRHGRAGLERVKRHFRREVITEAVMDLYARELSKAGLTKRPLV
jgi:glycosyltransferase involved in cell wall biosynthesis